MLVTAAGLLIPADLATRQEGGGFVFGGGWWGEGAVDVDGGFNGVTVHCPLGGDGLIWPGELGGGWQRGREHAQAAGKGAGRERGE